MPWPSKSDILFLGEMGIGNSTIASALCFALLGGELRQWVGPGTGLDQEGQGKKAQKIKLAVNFHKKRFDLIPDPALRAIDILVSIGGRELTAIMGAVIQARLLRIPIVLDGFICTAAALPLHIISKHILEHCLVGHLSKEPGHKILLDVLSKEPILDLGIHLGEGVGAALSFAIIQGALACHSGMLTFAEASVNTKI